MKSKRLLVLAFLVALFPLLTAKADPKNWLPEGSLTEAAGPPPTEYLKKGAILEGRPLLGKLLFNSPSMLGEKAVRLGLSCNSCHPNGHVNTSFYISGLSDKPGNIDLTNRFWRKGTEDNIFNPVPIPTLRNVSKTAPYGQELNLPSLVDFTRHVIVDEFDGPEPSQSDMKALISYMNLLEKESGRDMSAHAKTISSNQLIKLLAIPLKERDLQELEKRIMLLRQEFGRQVTNTNKDRLMSILVKLKAIQSSAFTNPVHADQIFQNLLNEDQ